MPAQIGEEVIFCGFPGVIREIVAWGAGNLWSFASASIVTSADKDWFSCRSHHDDLSQLDVRTTEDVPLLARLGGLSGGPVFRILTQPRLDLELIGVVSEGEPMFFGHQIVKSARRLDVVTSDGTMGSTVTKTGTADMSPGLE